MSNKHCLASCNIATCHASEVSLKVAKTFKTLAQAVLELADFWLQQVLFDVCWNESYESYESYDPWLLCGHFFQGKMTKKHCKPSQTGFQWFQASVPLFRLWSSGKMLGTPESTCRLDRLTLTREKKEKTHWRHDNLRPGGQGLPKWLKLCWQSPQRKKDFVKDRFVGYCWKYLIWLESRSQHFNHTALISFPDAWSKAPGRTKKDCASESLHPFGIFASGGRAWQEELL